MLRSFKAHLAISLAEIDDVVSEQRLRVRKFITYRKQAENGRYKSAMSGSYLVFGP